MNGSNLNTSLPCGGKNSKKPKKRPLKTKSPNGGRILTAADMYEPGFRIGNADICSPRTRLLVLITSAAAPTHSQHRQAIRMTWMNRYGPGVSMAFLVGTPQISETDPVAQVLEAEEQALQTRLNRIDNNSIDKTKENPKSKPSAAIVSGVADALVDPLVGDSGWFRFLRDREQNSGEGLDAQAMHGLNEAERAVQRVLGREHGRYGDLIQCQVRDTYNNLTLKSIAALEWTRQYCPWAKYLLKTDDDMFIDVRRLLRFIDKVETEAITKSGINIPRPLEQSEFYSMDADGFETPAASYFDIDLPPTIWGRLAHGWRPIRQHNSKYYVSHSQYASRVYPDFCTGPAYLMTRSAVNPLYEAALGRDFDIIDDDDLETKNDEVSKIKGREDNKDLEKGCGDSNQTLDDSSDKFIANEDKNNKVPYLKLEDVYLTGVVAERLTRRAAERQARQEQKEKMAVNGSIYNEKSGKTAMGIIGDTKKTKSKGSDIIVKVRRIHDDQFANKKITGRALERAICSGVSPGDTVGTGGDGSFSWFRWYWGDTAVEKDLKKKKKDQGVISIHMVKYFEQFDLWRRLMDGRTKCKS
jgi:hypothetical protein